MYREHDVVRFSWGEKKSAWVSLINLSFLVLPLKTVALVLLLLIRSFKSRTLNSSCHFENIGVDFKENPIEISPLGKREVVTSQTCICVFCKNCILVVLERVNKLFCSKLHCIWKKKVELEPISLRSRYKSHWNKWHLNTCPMYYFIVCLIRVSWAKSDTQMSHLWCISDIIELLTIWTVYLETKKPSTAVTMKMLQKKR